ncbi:hypothetical protein [Halarsenatibacter silvermanii]|uniref:Uncharacterized protein n=1 Tax=Halarsenatibacter silvermanii TaxID=321763 RepID=A0A1G9T0R0_9FIRM|nr:hypothetical protein [Halarsenatibacter silvermanii]SDM41304.1 hypothetical protein SAMN04488692_1334 [Halarsenatibacter silvermanii]
MTNNLPEFKVNELLSDSLCEPSIDLAVEYAELSFDELVNEVAEEIPFVRTLVTVGKTGLAIKEAHFVKKTLSFLKKFHTGDYDEEKMKRFREKMNCDAEYRNKVTNKIIVFIDKLSSEKKAKILSRLFIAHINEEYDWKTFIDLTKCLDSMFLLDFDVLTYLYNSNEPVKIKNISLKEREVNTYLLLASIERLKSFGFIASKKPTWKSVGEEKEERVFLNSIGKKFIHYV